MNIFFQIIGILILLYAVYGAIMFAIQNKMIFPGASLEAPEIQPELLSGVDKVWLETSFGKVEAWFGAVADGGEDPSQSPTVIFCHGNFELIDFCLTELYGFKRLGCNMLLVEYPGYGRSEGQPNEQTIKETFTIAYDWLLNERRVNPDKIIGYGRSLGGGVICALAAERKLQALILQSTFTSIKAMARRYFRPVLFLKTSFDNLAFVKTYENPLLIFHGIKDDLIPYEHGQQLYRNSPNARLISYDCTHNDLPPDWTIHWQHIRDFLEAHELLSGEKESR